MLLGVKLQLSTVDQGGDIQGREVGLYKTQDVQGYVGLYKAKAQSKATDLQITRGATQGFCCTNTSRSALSLAKRQVGQRL